MPVVIEWTAAEGAWRLACTHPLPALIMMGGAALGDVEGLRHRMRTGSGHLTTACASSPYTIPAMDHERSEDATIIWEFDNGQVSRIWTDTRQVFGNKLWWEGVHGVFPAEWQAEAEKRSGRRLSDLLYSAVGDDRPGDPSEVFLAFQREFAKYGIITVFAPHQLHGDVLERARRLEAGEPLPKPASCHLDVESVTELWDEIDDELTNGCGSTVDLATTVVGYFPEDFVDALESAAAEEAFLTISSVLDTLAEDDDYSQAFLALHELAAEHGIELTFEPHPIFGDLVERAQRLRADEPA